MVGARGEDALYGGAGNDELVEQRRPEPNLILAGTGRDKCYGGYQVPPNIERGCERHSQRSDRPHPGLLPLDNLGHWSVAELVAEWNLTG